MPNRLRRLNAGSVHMSRLEWVIVALLVASVIINYIDRADLSMAAPVLAKQLSLSPLQIGGLLSAFFWSYAFLQLFGVSGWVVDRFPVGIVFACGFLMWSATTIATGFLSGFVAIYTARLLLGAAESITYPCYSKIFTTHLPEHHRGRANALIDAGTKVGPAIGMLVAGLFIANLGWRVLFVAIGAGSAVWLIPWLKFMPRDRAVRENCAGPEVSIIELLKIRSAWGAFLGHFCGDYFFYFLLTWVPLYLVKGRGLSMRDMTWITTALFLEIATATVSAGWLSDHLIARGMSPTVVRKSVVVSGLLFASIFFPLTLSADLTKSLCFLFIASFCYGVFASNHWAISQTLSGPAMAGRWTSVQNGIGNLSGIAGPWLAGFFVETTGSSNDAFLVAAGVTFAGAVMWGLVVGPVEEVNWVGKARAREIRLSAHR